MSDILGKVRKLNWLLQESPTGVFSFNEMCSVLSDLMDANIYVANDKGKVLGVNYKIKSDSPTISDPETGNEVFPGEYNEELLKVKETTANLSGDPEKKVTGERRRRKTDIYGADGHRYAVLFGNRSCAADFRGTGWK